MPEKNQIQSLFRKNGVYLAILISFGIVGFIYWQEASIGKSTKALNWTGKAFGYLFLGLLLMAFRDLAYMIRIRILTDKKLSWKQAFRVIMLWEFSSAISPGVVGGSAAALFILKKEKIPIAKSTTIVIVTLILDNLFYVLFIPAVFIFINMASLFPSNLGGMQEKGMFLFWIGYGIITAITLVLILSLFFPQFIGGLVRLIYKLPFLQKRKHKGEQFSKDIKTTAITIRKKPFYYWVQLFGATIGSWLARFLVLNCVLFAFIEMDLFHHFIILGRELVMWLTMLITPTPGGSGMAEYAFSQLFLDYVQSAGLSAVGLALIWRTLSYYPYLFIGAVLLPKWLAKK